MTWLARVATVATLVGRASRERSPIWRRRPATGWGRVGRHRRSGGGAHRHQRRRGRGRRAHRRRARDRQAGCRSRSSSGPVSSPRRGRSRRRSRATREGGLAEAAILCSSPMPASRTRRRPRASTSGRGATCRSRCWRTSRSSPPSTSACSGWRSARCPTSAPRPLRSPTPPPGSSAPRRPAAHRRRGGLDRRHHRFHHARRPALPLCARARRLRSALPRRRASAFPHAGQRHRGAGRARTAARALRLVRASSPRCR